MTRQTQPIRTGWLARTGLAIEAVLVLAALGSRPLAAAEIQLRGECRATSGLITLGDIAEIRCDDDGERVRLAATDLVTAPAGGEKRVLTAREVQDLLSVRGVSLAGRRLTGARKVSILGVQRAAAKSPVFRSSPQQAKQAQRRLQTAVNDWIAEATPGAGSWTLAADLTPAQVQAVSLASQIAVVDLGGAPTTGARNVAFRLSAAQGESPLAIQVELTAPPMFVVASRNLSRGAILRVQDLRLAPGTAAGGATRIFTSIDDAVGKEVVRSLVVGQMLDEQSIRRPVIVQKSQIVKVYSLAEGVQVETKARSTEPGSLGDLISVESIAERKAFLARVSGEGEVEVMARPMTLRQPALAAGELPDAAARQQP